VRARLTSGETPAPGDKLYSAAYGDQASGMIVSVASAQPDSHELLAVVQVSSMENDVHWKTPDGPLLHMAPLPYAIT